jgi:hypothetical protein
LVHVACGLADVKCYRLKHAKACGIQMMMGGGQQMMRQVGSTVLELPAMMQ